MHRARSAAVRIAVGAALGFGLYVFALPSESGNPTLVYAIDGTPTPTVAPAGAAPTTAQTALQQTSDQITSVSQQITQAIQDPSTSIDSKVQLINSLSAQFNQLVAIWQQQLAQLTTAAPVANNAAPTPATTTTTTATLPVCNTTMCPPVSVAGVQATPTALTKPAR